MKKVYFVILTILCLSATVNAQTVDEALRYSRLFYGGTARFMSMGGAFTALGGDLSTLSQNPAGIGVYRSSEITLTPQLFHIRTDSRFRGTNSDYLYNFNLSQAGFVTNLVTDENNLTLNWGYSFNKTANLNQTALIQGISNNSSMADFWANSNTTNKVFYEDLVDAAGIAYDTWIIDTLRNSQGKSYGTVFDNYGDASSVYGQRIRRLISNEGYMAEHAISFGGNYANRIFFGATVGINRLRYTNHFEHLESTEAILPSEFADFTFIEHFENRGTGINLKIGAIFRPVDALRIGVAFHSPTWYRITETADQSIASSFTHGGKYSAALEPLRYEYALMTPFRALAGAAVQIGKMGLLSADYEYVDYSMARFSETGDDYNYNEKNNAIRQTLKAAHNVRLGGELRLSKVYFRGGYGFYGSTFAAGDDNDDMTYNSLSFGLGFREQRVSVDLGFTSLMNDQDYVLYPLPIDYNPKAVAGLDITRNMFTLTLGYKFGF
jgi:hypothetical protein